MSLECGHRRPVQTAGLGDRDRRGAPPREFPHQRRERACTPALHPTRQRLEDSDSQPSRRRGLGRAEGFATSGEKSRWSRVGAGILVLRGNSAREERRHEILTSAPRLAPHANRKGHDLRGETCLTLNPRTAQLPRFTRLHQAELRSLSSDRKVFQRSARGSSSAPTSRRCWRRRSGSSRR